MLAALVIGSNHGLYWGGGGLGLILIIVVVILLLRKV